MKLTELATISAGHPFRGKIPEKTGSGIRAVQMKDISIEQGVCWDTVVKTELAGKKQPDWLMNGDILFAARGSRNYAVLMNQVIGQVVSAPHFYILRMNEQSLLPEFLVWQLNQKPLQNYFDRAAQGSFTKSIKRAILEGAEITVPSLEKQKQILGLHNTVIQEKNLYAQLSINADKFMNSIANELVAGKTLQIKGIKI